MTAIDWFKTLPGHLYDCAMVEMEGYVYNEFSLGTPEKQYDKLSHALYYALPHVKYGYDFWDAVIDQAAYQENNFQ